MSGLGYNMSNISNFLLNEMLHTLLLILLICLPACAPTPYEEKAASSVRTIADAIKAFRSQYGYNPISSKTLALTPLGAALPVLLALSNSTSAVELNPKGIHFLDIPPHCLQRGEYIDPWGNPYHAVLAKNGSGATEVGGVLIKDPVAVWSNGRNRKNEAGNGDDICSWKR